MSINPTDNSTNNQEILNVDHDLTNEVNKQLRFEPPLYQQRYDYVKEILAEYKCTTYMDIGCAECKLVRYIKNTNTNLNLIIGLDYDVEVLRNGTEKLSSSWFDYIQPREDPLDLYLINGDVSKPSEYFLQQSCLDGQHLDCVSLVEIIEHLYPDTLANCVVTVFKKLKPKVVVITTPNSDFNIVFDDLEKNSPTLPIRTNKFRHWDHKFEWTRKEFQDWCESILLEYPDYELVKYDGLGIAPKEYTDIGYCSQIVLFKKKHANENCTQQPSRFDLYLKQQRKHNYVSRQNNNFDHKKPEQTPYFNVDVFEQENLCKPAEDAYKLITSIQYPFKSFEFDTIESRNDALFQELDYLVQFLTRPSKQSRYSSEYMKSLEVDVANLTEEQLECIANNIDIDDDQVRIGSIEKLFSFVSIVKFKMSRSELIELMKERNYEFTKSGNYVINRSVYVSSDEEEEEEFDSGLDYQNHSWSRHRCDSSNEDENYYKCDNSNENNADETAKFMDEEDWDKEIEKTSLTTPILPDRVYSPEEQFGNDDDNDAENKSVSIDKIEEIFGKQSIRETHFTLLSTESSLDHETVDSSQETYEINYNAFRVKELALKFKSIKKKISKEHRRQIRKQTLDESKYLSD